MRKQFRKLFLPKKEATNREKARAVALTFLFVLLSGIVVSSISDLNHTADPQKSYVELEGMIGTLPAVKVKKEQAALPKPTDTVPIDIAKSSPFVKAEEKQSAPPQTKAATAQTGVAPALPLPNIPTPDLQAANQPMPDAARDEAVRGVFIGGGRNMAILLDGSLVQEGEAYRESRITVIDQSGITLENGCKIAYGVKE